MTRRKKAKKLRSKKPHTKAYPFEFRLKVVKLHLEEGYSPTMLTEELGVGRSTVGAWGKKSNDHHPEKSECVTQFFFKFFS